MRSFRKRNRNRNIGSSPNLDDVEDYVLITTVIMVIINNNDMVRRAGKSRDLERENGSACPDPPSVAVRAINISIVPRRRVSSFGK